MKKTWILSTALAGLLAAPVASAGPLADATSDMLWGIELGGYMQLGSTYNFDSPDNEMNFGRIFDTDDADLIDFHAFQFYADKLPEDVNEVGFRIDGMFGEDATGVGGGDGVLDSGDFNLYQAYVSYIAPVGNGLTLDAGRFVTWHGYELIESPLNDNISRSFLFGYAIPFTHTGFRGTYTFNEMVEASVGVTQGWDTVEDNNDSPSYHFALRLMPMETVYVQNSVAFGPEATGNNSDNTILYDLVATWQATPQFLVGANFDWGSAEDLAVGGSDAEWMGFAGYLRYDINDKLYAAVRGEYFDDQDGYRFSTVSGYGAHAAYSGGAFVAPGDVEVWETTITLGYEVVEGLMTRLEYRHDDAEDEIFFGDDMGEFEDTQDTIAFEIIYSF